MTKSGNELSNVIPLRDPAKPAADERRNEPSLFQGIVCEKPPCPKWLKGSARAHFYFIVGELERAGLVAKIDQGALAILAVSYARMKEAEEQLALEGEFQTTPNGYVQLSPYAVAWERHSSKYEKLCVKFGITVRARQSIKVDNPNQGALEFE
jgi:P27 family predicted phage terminase small subunit